MDERITTREAETLYKNVLRGAEIGRNTTIDVAYDLVACRRERDELRAEVEDIATQSGGDIVAQLMRAKARKALRDTDGTLR